MRIQLDKSEFLRKELVCLTHVTTIVIVKSKNVFLVFGKCVFVPDNAINVNQVFSGLN